MLGARETLEDYGGVFLDRGCLFVSTTGKFLTGYVNCEVIFPYHRIVRDLVEQMVDPFLGAVEGFICPAIGDIVLLQAAAACVPQTVAVWADKTSDGNYRVERNGFEAAIWGKKVVVLNDRISQGGTTLKVIAEARRLDCNVLGVATLAGVSSVSPRTLDVPLLHALCTIDVQAFYPGEEPNEYRGMPIATDEALGHGAEFMEQYPLYRGGFITLLS